MKLGEKCSYLCVIALFTRISVIFCNSGMPIPKVTIINSQKLIIESRESSKSRVHLRLIKCLYSYSYILGHLHKRNSEDFTANV